LEKSYLSSQIYFLASKDLKQEKKTEEKKEEVPKPAKTQVANSASKNEPQAVSEKDFDLEKDTKISDDSTVPDWLKGSFDEPKSEKTKDKKDEEKLPLKAEKKQTPKTEVNKPVNTVEKPQKQEDPKDHWESEAGVKTKVAEDKKSDNTEKKPVLTDADVPDWLKGSFDEPKKTDVPEQKPDTTSDKEVAINSEKPDEKTSAKTAPKKKTPPKKTTKKVVEDSTEAETKKTEKKDELWDDGMKIPDWLKADE